jgi:LAO/AO transport system kinase
LIRAQIKESAPDNKISCQTLRKIAEQAGVPYRKAGETANELKVKIKNCELGCF